MGKYFNLSVEEKAFARENLVFCLVIYDIMSNKRRLKLVKILQGFGIRVQRSCFEMQLRRSDYHELVKVLERFYDEESGDDIAIYVTSKKDKVAFRQSVTEEILEDSIFL